MSVLNEIAPTDGELQSYLLGLLPDEDAERLDELSIIDDQVAERLRIVEDDLVDAYINGELAGETLERFESSYLASERRREKVRFARTLLGARRVPRPADATGPQRPVRALTDERERSSETGTPKHGPSTQRYRLAWTLAAAASVLLVAGGLVYERAQLRTDLREAQRASAELSDRTRELQQQLDERRAVPTEVPAAREAPPPALPVIALVLLPQTRAIGPVPTIAVPQALDRIALDLRVEPNDFPRHEVVLKDPAVDRIVWRSERISARSVDGVRTVSIVIPAALLKPQHYSIELNGIAPAGSVEVAGSYAFEVVRR